MPITNPFLDAKRKINKPILGPNKSPLLGGKINNLNIPSLNPHHVPVNTNVIRKTQTFNNNVNLSPVRESINNLVLEFFGPAATPTNGAAPIGGSTVIQKDVLPKKKKCLSCRSLTENLGPRVPFLQKVSTGPRIIRQHIEPQKQTPFHNPIHTKEGLPVRWGDPKIGKVPNPIIRK